MDLRARPYRHPLPLRRAATTHQFEQGGIPYTASFGFYEDESVGEVFINGPRQGSDAQVNATDAAVIMSIAMQYGVPAEVLRAAISRSPAGVPLGPVGVVLDLIADHQVEQLSSEHV